MKGKMVLAAVATALLATPAMADHHATIVGDWDTVTESPMGNFEATMSIASDDDGYTVEIQDTPPEGGQAMPPMESTISDVSIDGNTLTFLRTLSTPQGPMELTYSLTAEGDSLSGEANSSFGAIPISGTRAAAE